MTTWTPPDDSRYAAGSVLEAADLNNLEGNFAHLAAGGALLGRATAAVTLSTSIADVTGASVTLTAGKWVIFGAFVWNCDTASDAASEVYGELWVDGSKENFAAIHKVGGDQFGNATQIWTYTATSSVVAKLRSKKNGGAGTTSTHYSSNNFGPAIIAVRYSPSTS